MNTQAPERQWFNQMLTENRQVLADDNQSWLEQTRQQARASLELLPLPHRKQETWHYTDFSKLYAKNFYSQTVPVTGMDIDDIDAWV
ncbi:MAG: hypothetical protein P8Z72_16770, partial [Gammaproteobacteria bacterium]